MTDRASERLEEILAELGHIGAVLPGSIAQRRTRCQRSGCHCRSEPSVLHGPYPTWTWRPSGVPVTKDVYKRQVPDLGKLVAGLEVAEPQRVLNLVHKLQEGRHARGGVEPELDRRRGPASLRCGLAVA